MYPFLSAGVALAATKGLEYLSKSQKPARLMLEAATPTAPDQPMDAVLAGLAIAPQLINVLGPSMILERFYPLSLDNLYRLVKARPYLEGVSMLALAGLAYRQRQGKTEGKYMTLSMQAVGGLRVAANVVSSPTAFSPHDEGHLVVTFRELNRNLNPDDEVLGLYLNGEARCYPLEILKKPHLIHDTVGGVAVVPTFCELTNTAIAFRDDWQGERLDLNVVGSPNNNVVFYEGHSDGLIQQLDAAIGAGPNKGDMLQTFPLVLTTWKNWREMQPETTGLWFEQGVKGNVVKSMLDLMGKYDNSQSKPLFKVRGGVDERLPAKQQVLGVRFKGQARAFTREHLKANPVINLDLAGEPVVVLYDAKRDVAACYSRRVDGAVLTFESAQHGKGIASDKETGLIWEVSGCATDKQATESCLKPVAFTVDKVRWFAWAHFLPHTEIVGDGRRARRAQPV